ncbi:carbohydrate-binding protein [Streptomyces sp. 35M1]|uniref:carbohydrate-binding protein n=1 Tax=Streptomyces sp. 35M1 TaxID=3142978 RepID=UPI003990CF26
MGKIDSARQCAEAWKEQQHMSEVTEGYPEWGINQPYQRGEEVKYQGKRYKCTQPHTSMREWSPDITPTLWREISPA